MRLRDLEVFRAVVELGKTTAAAEHLGISQPAVSRVLAQLQVRLGRELFRHRGNRLEPTADAYDLNLEIEPIFAVLARVDLGTGRGEGGLLRIACPATLAENFLDQLVSAFLRNHPEYRLSLWITDVDRMISEVLAGNCDLGLTPRDADSPVAGIAIEPFRTAIAHVLMPVGHRLATCPSVTPEDIGAEPLITIPASLRKRQKIDEVFRQRGLTPRVVAESNSIAICAHLVRERIGIGIHNPFPVAGRFEQGLVLRPFEPAVPYQTSFVWRQRGQLPAPARAFVDFVRRHQPEDPYSVPVR
jgi:DNA-binding transcriptional LysR family regulator